MFHVEGLKYPAKSAEVCCFLLSLVDYHKELSLPLAQMNKTYLSCVYRQVQNAGHRSQVTDHRSQVIGHRS